MTPRKDELRCPFCRTVLAPHVTVCHRCKAQRRTRRGMSPRGFRMFFAIWMALALPLMGAACFVGFAPWGPAGSPPPYALALIGAKPSADEVVRCRVEVVEPDGRKTVKLLDAQCREPVAAAPAEGEPSPTQQRLATALHTALSLLTGLTLSVLLLPLVRLLFLRKSTPSWVRRVTI
ncbi:hypothetical protein [Ramlibacter henchirensis]|nr:hypothetical protein [Ramlibacter henchirensis]